MEMYWVCFQETPLSGIPTIVREEDVQVTLRWQLDIEIARKSDAWIELKPRATGNK